MPGETATDRRVIRITGGDRDHFLQGLVTNDIAGLKDGLVYAALLNPQGKYLADFFLVPADGAILLDVKAELADDLMRRLTMYKLRADVALEITDLSVTRGTGTAPDGAFVDPRHPGLGWRQYGTAGENGETDWDAIRVAHCIPETGIELIPNETYILEAGFDRLHGVDFRKGCYVGQEVTARMRHKTDLRKGLARVRLDGRAPVGTEITANGKTAGRIYTQADGQAIAYLRFDRAKGEMLADQARVVLPDQT